MIKEASGRFCEPIWIWEKNDRHREARKEN